MKFKQKSDGYEVADFFRFESRNGSLKFAGDVSFNWQTAGISKQKLGDTYDRYLVVNGQQLQRNWAKVRSNTESKVNKYLAKCEKDLTTSSQPETTKKVLEQQIPIFIQNALREESQKSCVAAEKATLKDLGKDGGNIKKNSWTIAWNVGKFGASAMSIAIGTAGAGAAPVLAVAIGGLIVKGLSTIVAASRDLGSATKAAEDTHKRLARALSEVDGSLGTSIAESRNMIKRLDTIKLKEAKTRSELNSLRSALSQGPRSEATLKGVEAKRAQLLKEGNELVKLLKARPEEVEKALIRARVSLNKLSEIQQMGELLQDSNKWVARLSTLDSYVQSITKLTVPPKKP